MMSAGNDTDKRMEYLMGGYSFSFWRFLFPVVFGRLSLLQWVQMIKYPVARNAGSGIVR